MRSSNTECAFKQVCLIHKNNSLRKDLEKELYCIAYWIDSHFKCAYIYYNA